jgi:pyrimidine operon attenuation protein/uracil phosphoribosyltransferase
VDPLLQLLGQVKDPAVVVLVGWLIVEVRGLRSKIGRVLDSQADHDKRLTVLEDRGERALPVARPVR